MQQVPINKVYAAEYLWCIYEGSFSVISLHKTITGAYKAMKEHKMDCYDYGKYWHHKGRKPNESERWRFRVIEVED